MNDERQARPRTNPFRFGVTIGFFAGLFFGGLKIVEYALRFSLVSPAFLAQPFYRESDLLAWWGTMIGWAFFVAFSIAAALLYAALLRRMRGPWPGFAYGVVWWAAIYLLIGPAAGMLPPIGRADANTIVVDLCLFAVWGLFIGYSIAYEFTDEYKREKPLPLPTG